MVIADFDIGFEKENFLTLKTLRISVTILVSQT